VNQKISKFVNTTITGFEIAGMGVESFIRGLRTINLLHLGMKAAVANFVSFSNGMYLKLSTFFYENVQKPIIDFMRMAEKLPFVGDRIKMALNTVDKDNNKAIKALQKLNSKIEQVAKSATDTFKSEWRSLVKDIDSGFESSKIADQLRKGLEQFDKELEKEKTKKMEIPVDVKPELKQPSDESMEKYKKSMENLLNRVTSMKKDADSEQDESTRQSANSMKDSFSDVVTDWKSSLDSMVRSSDISFSSIGKSFLNHVTTKFSTKMFDAGFDAIGSFLFPGFATGGYFDGGFRIVGENGPELEATGPARIYNSQETKQILSGSNSDSSINVVQNFDFSGSGQDVEERVMRLVPMIKDQTIAAWAEMKARGEL
jgi:hypothetical protein